MLAGLRAQMEQPESSTRFRLCAATLLALSLAPVWLAAALPMQDYPQHLFISAVLRGDHAEWAQFYERQLTLTPYTGFYWVTCALAPVLGLDGAGRAFVTLYLLLFALWLWRLQRQSVTPPWAALTVFPFAFSPVYFHGFVNYLMALPLLMLALQELRKAAARRQPARRLALHTLLLLAIAWFHPLCLYVYAGLGALELALTRGAATPAGLRALPGLLALALLAAWQLSSYHDAEKLVWWPPTDRSLGYLGLLFGGARGSLLHAACLLGVGLAVAASKPLPALDRRDLLHALALLLGYLALPFRIGSYTYVSWRLLPLFGLALAACLARVPLSRRASWIVALGCGLAVADTGLLQLQVGRESAEIQPLLRKVQPSARSTSINFTTRSRYLDEAYFPLMHEHDYFYYPLAAGSVSPFLWSDPLIPVRKRASLTLSAPRSLPELVKQDYGVVFSRGAPPELTRVLASQYALKGESGAWRVYERRK